MASLDWGIQYPINFTPAGDLTATAIHQHIQEIAKIYGHLNYLRGNVDGGATIGISKFVPSVNDLPAGGEYVGEVYMTNGDFYNLYVWDGVNWVQLNTSALPMATTSTPGIAMLGTLEGYQSDTPSQNKVVNEYMLKQVSSTLAASSVPSGTITMWWGVLSNLPVGWVLCDGNNGTPDLRGMFPRCMPDFNGTPGLTGGQDNVALSVDNIPNHRHQVKLENLDARHTHTVPVSSHTHSIALGATREQSQGHTHYYNNITGLNRTSNNHAHDLYLAGANCRAIADASSAHDHTLNIAVDGTHWHTAGQIGGTPAYFVTTTAPTGFETLINQDAGAPNATKTIDPSYAFSQLATTTTVPNHSHSGSSANRGGNHEHILNGNTGFANLDHNHDAAGDTGFQSVSHTHAVYGNTEGGGQQTPTTNSMPSFLLSSTFDSEAAGNGISYSNLPKYREMFFIMKL